ADPRSGASLGDRPRGRGHPLGPGPGARDGSGSRHRSSVARFGRRGRARRRARPGSDEAGDVTLSGRLLGYLRPYVWPRFALAVVCMVLYSSTNGVMPYLVRSVFDDVFLQKKEWALRLLPVVIVTVFLFRAAMSFNQSYLMEWIGQHVIADIRSQLNGHFQRLSLSFYNRTPTATLLSRMTNAGELMRSALTDAVASVMKDLTSLLVLIAVAFFMDWTLALIAFVAFPVTVLPILRLSRRLRRVTRKGQVTLGNLATLLQETIQGNRVVKAFGMEE